MILNRGAGLDKSNDSVGVVQRGLLFLAKEVREARLIEDVAAFAV